MPSIEVLLFRLMLVIIVSGLIGAEREYRNKSAGFRTMILICLGSFLFTTFSYYITDNSPDRIASNIVTGIGFLGAGVIFQSENRINGLTTAATIWSVAALGMGIAAGQYILVLFSTAVVLAALLLLTKLEKWIDYKNQSRTYRIVSSYKKNEINKYEQLIKENKLHYKILKKSKREDDIIGTWIVNGKKINHQIFVEKLLNDPSVKEFDF
ncbi:MgtC/SapB family protein [Chitinophagaceae bacterium LB-8]|uniref:MgtC/SapB family protein n=1 Tax=Paraflavisolibacter caeni TaxID=2982496 RepID=A0A9X2XRY0_9BACT|nr:MgtC/SapB family protein [Paraflavisolibacter caeni]MCU7547470.1 MgtC/SapB family protein [Paraflavisolibacter caeni]